MRTSAYDGFFLFWRCPHTQWFPIRGLLCKFTISTYCTSVLCSLKPKQRSLLLPSSEGNNAGLISHLNGAKRVVGEAKGFCTRIRRRFIPIRAHQTLGGF